MKQGKQTKVRKCVRSYFNGPTFTTEPCQTRSDSCLLGFILLGESVNAVKFLAAFKSLAWDNFGTLIKQLPKQCLSSKCDCKCWEDWLPAGHSGQLDLMLTNTNY